MNTSDLETVEVCNLCGSRNTRLDEIYRIKGVDFPMLECVSCGLAFVGARPPQDAMDDWYQDFSHPDYAQSVIQRAATPVLRWLLGRARPLAGDDGLVKTAMAGVRMRTWRRLLSKYHAEWVERPCDCLDVGCGNGVWMAAQRRWGFRCEGVEPDKRAAAKARALGFPVRAGDLLNAGYPEARFDFVHFSHVLEHVRDPLGVLVEAARITRPGGRVVVVVPNHNGVPARAFRNVEDVPRHLYAFSAHVLGRYFARVGLTTERLYTETPDPWSLYGPLYHASARLAKSDHAATRAVKEFWQSPTRRQEFAKQADLADAIDAGAQVVAIGRKPAPEKPPASTTALIEVASS